MPRDGKGGEPFEHRDDDERRRRRSVIGLFLVVGLIAASLYVGHILKRSAALEDCIMQGRTNCAPIDTGKD